MGKSGGLVEIAERGCRAARFASHVARRGGGVTGSAHDGREGAGRTEPPIQRATEIN